MNRVITRATVYGVHRAITIAERTAVAASIDAVGAAASAYLIFARQAIDVILLRPAVEIVVTLVPIEFVWPGCSKDPVVPIGTV